MKDFVVVELTKAQLDNLLSNKVSKMKEVIDYIRINVENKDIYLDDNCEHSNVEW